MQFRRVLVGVDFTEASLAAVRWAALHFAPEAEVVLVHALPESDAPSYLRPFLPSPLELSASLAPVFRGALRGLAGIIGADRTRVHVTAGLPAAALAGAASELGVDLVCGGRGGDRGYAGPTPGALHVGSATRRVAWAAPCPVLVLPLDRAGAASAAASGRGARDRQVDARPAARSDTGEREGRA